VVSTADGHDEPIRQTPSVGNVEPRRYEIRLRGRLGARWSDWFDGLQIVAESDGTSVLRGPVADQAALHGVLQRLRDLGIPIVSLIELPVGPAADDPDSTPHQQ
jgi:hypothetical protein